MTCWNILRLTLVRLVMWTILCLIAAAIGASTAQAYDGDGSTVPDADGLIPRNAANADGKIVYGIAANCNDEYKHKIVLAANGWNAQRAESANKDAIPQFWRKHNHPNAPTTLRVLCQYSPHGGGHYTHNHGIALDFVVIDYRELDQRPARNEQRIVNHEMRHSQGAADNPFSLSYKMAVRTTQLQSKFYIISISPWRSYPHIVWPGPADARISNTMAGEFWHNGP